MIFDRQETQKTVKARIIVSSELLPFLALLLFSNAVVRKVLRRKL